MLHVLVCVSSHLFQVALYLLIASSAASIASGVHVFGSELHIYWREASSGHSKLAYYIGVSTAQLYRIVITSAHFSYFFHMLARPHIGPGILFVALLDISFWSVS